MELYRSMDITLITICDICNTIFHILKQSVRDPYHMKTVSPTLSIPFLQNTSFVRNKLTNIVLRNKFANYRTNSIENDFIRKRRL